MDWVWELVGNGLWVLGLALLLAALSWAHWLTSERDVALRAALRRPGLRLAVDGGLLLFCAGLATVSERLWERVIWSVLAVVWVVQAVLNAGARGRRGA